MTKSNVCFTEISFSGVDFLTVVDLLKSQGRLVLSIAEALVLRQWIRFGGKLVTRACFARICVVQIVSFVSIGIAFGSHLCLMVSKYKRWRRGACRSKGVRRKKKQKEEEGQKALFIYRRVDLIRHVFIVTVFYNRLVCCWQEAGGLRLATCSYQH